MDDDEIVGILTTKGGWTKDPPETLMVEGDLYILLRTKEENVFLIIEA